MPPSFLFELLLPFTKFLSSYYSCNTIAHTVLCNPFSAYTVAHTTAVFHITLLSLLHCRNLTYTSRLKRAESALLINRVPHIAQDTIAQVYN